MLLFAFNMHFLFFFKISTVKEPFIDLSLPIIEERVRNRICNNYYFQRIFLYTFMKTFMDIHSFDFKARNVCLSINTCTVICLFII